jgi:hypothetical protein
MIKKKRDAKSLVRKLAQEKKDRAEARKNRDIEKT